MTRAVLRPHPSAASRSSLGGVAIACVGLLAVGGDTASARVVGNGTARSCTSAAAVRPSRHVRVACGPKSVTITLRATAKVLNTRREVRLDGGGLVTLSGGGKRRNPLHEHLRPRAREGGGAIFFVSNDRTGTLAIAGSRLEGNPSKGFETRGLPGIFFLGAGKPAITGSTLR